MIFFDFEVFEADWMVVFEDAETERETVIVNDREQLEEFYSLNRERIFVGYNVRNYDQWIFKGILAGFDPKEINDFIIVQGRKGWEFSQTLRSFPLVFFDLYQSIDRGLKFFEGCMGHSIKETSVSFNLGRSLTPQEIEETINYCRHDVEETMQVFLQRRADFDAQMGLLKLFNLPLSDLAKTKPQLSAKVLGASRHSYDDEFKIDFPKTLRIERYRSVLEWYENPNNRCYERERILRNGKISTEKNALKIDVAGVPHVFGRGGVHGAREKYHAQGYFINVDVASLYPALMIRYDLMSRSVPNPEKFEEIRDLRIKYKGEKNPLQAPLKIVLNSTYGAMKDEFNPLFDPRQANRVCVYGQLLLLDLIERFEEIGAEIIQSNTDGILLEMPNDAKPDLFFGAVDDAAYEWEERTGLRLDFDEFSTIYQKDVNNYVMVAPDGSFKSKGAYVKKLSGLDYDLAVVNRAVVDFMIRGVDPAQTIYECDSLRDFQTIARASSKYSTLLHGYQVLREKTARVFASTNEDDAGMGKLHWESGRVQKCAGTPEHCFIVNDDLTSLDVPPQLDFDWYVALAAKRLDDFGITL